VPYLPKKIRCLPRAKELGNVTGSTNATSFWADGLRAAFQRSIYLYIEYYSNRDKDQGENTHTP
jgi:hypothetical protein